MSELRDIPGFDGLYAVTDDGRVFSRRRGGKWMSPGRNRFGYLHVCISTAEGKRKTHRIARLVAMTFIPNPDNKPQVNHKDGNKTNNAVGNLEWATCAENIAHAWSTGLKGEKARAACRKSIKLATEARRGTREAL